MAAIKPTAGAKRTVALDPTAAVFRMAAADPTAAVVRMAAADPTAEALQTAHHRLAIPVHLLTMAKSSAAMPMARRLLARWVYPAAVVAVELRGVGCFAYR